MVSDGSSSVLEIVSLAARLATSTAEGVGEMATGTEYANDTQGNKFLTPEGVWDAMGAVALSDAATIVWDMSLGFDFSVTISGNRTLGNPSNVTPGKRGRIKVTASGGTRTINKNTNMYSSQGVTWPQSIASGDSAYIYYDAESSTRIIITGVINDPA